MQWIALCSSIENFVMNMNNCGRLAPASTGESRKFNKLAQGALKLLLVRVFKRAAALVRRLNCRIV